MNKYKIRFEYVNAQFTEVFIDDNLEISEFSEKFMDDIENKNFVNFVGSDPKIAINMENVIFFTIEKFGDE